MFRYVKDVEMKNNNLKKIRIELGLTITALSKLTNVSTKVISQTERMLIDPTPVTKSKILNGLNVADSLQKQKFSFEDIFPGEDV